MRDNNEGSKEGPHRYAREYDEEYYLDSDGHLQCYADLSVSGSGLDVDSPGTTPRKATDESDPGGETDNSGSLKEELIALLLSGIRVKRGFTMRKQDSRPKKDERAYEAEYDQDSDGHVQRCADFLDSDL